VPSSWIGEEAANGAIDGAHLILVDDGGAFRDGRHPIDPHLALSRIDTALRLQKDSRGEGYRRRVALVLRSGALRNLHDLAMAIALGADAINPYLMLDIAMHADNPEALKKPGRRAAQRLREGDQHDGHPRAARLWALPGIDRPGA